MKAENKENQPLLENLRAMRSGAAWDRGVIQYARELVEGAEIPLTLATLRAALLNGAENWDQYSQGGCALIWNADIADRLCTPSELKRKRGGELQPSRRETWLDCQARALQQAESLIRRALRRMEPFPA